MEYANVQYHPVEKTKFHDIAISLKDKFGFDIKFNESYLPTKIVLHFRKRNNLNNIT
jgi:hypothetical protein